MTNNTFNKIRDAFINELKTDGNVWRILRKSTLVDLIKLNFFYFKNDKNEKRLIDIFNNSMKIKLISRIKAIEIKGSLDEVSKEFNNEPILILEQYEIIFNKLEPAFRNHMAINLYDLSGKIQYIKVVNELENDSYADDIFEEIIAITYNILKTM